MSLLMLVSVHRHGPTPALKHAPAAASARAETDFDFFYLPMDHRRLALKSALGVAKPCSL